MKFIRLLLLGMLCAFAFSASAQLTLGTVDPGPYTPGSNIAALFSINPTTCIPQGNRFNLRLSDATGNFTPGTIIGFYDSFYSTFVNGTIPTGTPIGTGYRVRIESTSTGLISGQSAAFSVVAGAVLNARITSVTINAANPETFGFCAGKDNNNFALTNVSTAGSTVTAVIKDEINGTVTTIPFTTTNKSFLATLAHYTVFTKAEMGGTVATKANFIVNNQAVTAFSTSGGDVKCLPTDPLVFTVVDNSPGGIQNNFPGDTYVVNWGDLTAPSSYTICEIRQNAGKIQHLYTESSCGRSVTINGNTEYNVFAINIGVESPFCGRVGSPLSTTARVVTKPINNFNGPPNVCTGASVSYVNTSILGDNPLTNSPGCEPNTVVYNWYVDGQLELANAPLSQTFNFTFTTNGQHTITLESVSSGACNGDNVSRTVCVQNPPQPSFNFGVTTICSSNTPLKPTNTSVIDATCNAANSYVWSVTPAVSGYANGTNATSPEPEFIFNTPGVYRVILLVSTATCGTIASTPVDIVVNGTPTADLSNNASLCNLGTYDFNPTTPGPTRTVFTGTSLDLSDTYTWTITPATFAYRNGTTANSKYPRIEFLVHDTYVITAVHKNTCGTVSDTQTISFTPAPTVDAGTYAAVCNDVANIPLNATITGSYNTATWTGGAGSFSPDNHALNAIYTPTTAERTSGTVNLTLTVLTSLPSPCNSIPAFTTLTIKPAVVVTSANSKSICTGKEVNYIPTSSTAGATYAWTAVGSANATGFSAVGSGEIHDFLTNTNATANATVTYTITPTGNGCDGAPFTFTVTITPIPVLTLTAANPTICSQQSSGITLTSNLGPTTRYTWTSTATGGLIGNGANSTPMAVTTINEPLANNGTTAETVTYTITPISASGCPGTPEMITITVEPQPTTPNAGASKSICNQTSYTLEGNQPTVGTGKWTQVTAFAGVNIINDTNFDAVADGILAGNTYIFRWTITGAASCTPKTSDVTITVDPPSFGGTTSGNQAVCAGTNTGQITLTGNIGNVIRWESSADGVTWPTTINETSTTLLVNNLSATTYFRAVVQSGTCSFAVSTPSIITVNQPVITANAGSSQVLCSVTSTTLNGNLPNPNTGLWTVVPAPIPGVTFDDATLPNATVSGLVPGQTYTFRWTISGTAPCPPSSSDVTVQIDLPSNGGTTAGSAPVCAANNTGNITVSGQTGSILEWQSSTDGFVTFATISSTATSIPYLNLTVTTQYRAVVKNGACGPAFSSVSTITVNQNAVAAAVGANQTLCNEDHTTLDGNSPLTNTGLWTYVSGPAGYNITSPTLYNTNVTGLVGGATYIFKWTIFGAAPCGATSADLTIVNLPALQNNTISTPITTNCAGQIITLTGTQPTGGSGTYTYVWESSPTGAAPWTIISGQTGRDLNVTVASSLAYRRTVTGGVCSTISNIITINALPAIANNTVASDQNICLTTTPNVIIGSQPTGGDGTNYTYGWEQSTDEVVWVFVPGATAKDYAPPALTQTTSYRRLVSSAACTGTLQNVSPSVKIIVNPNAKAEYTFVNDIGCVPYVLDANNIKAIHYADRNSTYTWFADGVQIGTGLNFPGLTINTYNANVVIRLVVTSSLGCLQDEFTHTFSTRENIIAAFNQTATEGCGPLSVTFTNATPVAAGNIYEWSIDGTVVSTATDLGQRSFVTDPTGKDKVYEISLKVTSTCGVNTIVHQVTVKADPVPAISPQSTTGCSPYTATFYNTSPGGTNNNYQIDYGDGSPLETHAFGDVLTHTYTTNVVRDYEIRMTATNLCTVITSAPVIIRVSPNNIIPLFFAQGNQQTVCVGTTVDFRNNTAGASTFTYDFGDGSTPVISPTPLPETVSHRYDRAGTYTATMVATNACSSNSASQQITVLAAPTTTFTGDITIGCTGLPVKFTQVSTDAISYFWDFGDGTTSTDPAPTHVYTNAAPGQYTVTLTVMNSLRCSITSTRTSYITIVGPPKAAFAISPAAVISIPEYTFKFTNESTINPQTYRWSFGDGDFSTQKDPIHTYADTGKFLVTLRTYNEQGCVDSIQKFVQIVGIPGYTFVPNSFIPGGTSVPLQKFTAVGSGMKTWKMTIFNKWGQVLWETTKLDDGKPVEGWDGTFKGVPQPQGIYFWKIEVELINGTEWKGMSLGNAPPRRTGQIYLIR